ncbi:MAG: AAA family ATPase [Alphaproteobacteria bacterium]|nr:AAA family ATPase [Alphaproteobacteria bacterium]
MRVVFLGGPPGSGKTTLAEEAACQVAGLRVVTAGRLIKAGLSREAGYTRPPVADHDRAAFFQELLVLEFDVLRSTHTGPWLIDGHYAVPTGEGPANIPPSVFERLGCSDLLLVEAEVGVLLDRLRSRGGADWWDGSRHSVAELVGADADQAAVVAAAMGLNVQVVSTVEQVVAVVRALEEASPRR